MTIMVGDANGVGPNAGVFTVGMVPRVAALAIEIAQLNATPHAHRQAVVIQKKLAKEFANRQPWAATQRGFTLAQLGRRSNRSQRGDWGCSTRVADHPYFYRELERPYKPAAIAAHLYDWPDQEVDVKEAVQEFGLSYRVVRDFPSWWYPGETTLILYTPK